jgi:kynurenine formamidase
MCPPGTIETVREQTERKGLPHVDRRTALLGGLGVAVGAALPDTALAVRPAKKRFQDLTHVFRAGFPIYGTPPTFLAPTRKTIVEVVPDGFYGQEWTFWEHSGTHMDAPGHFVADGRRAPQITPSELLVPIVVIDISSRVGSDPDAVVTRDDLRAFERRHGRIRKRALVAMYSGWESRIGDAAAFRNADASGVLHFPGFGEEALDWQLARRSITAIGVDTLSLDHGASTTFDVPVTLLGKDKYGIENLANLKRNPAARRARVRRADPVGGGLRRSLPGDRELVSRSP